MVNVMVLFEGSLCDRSRQALTAYSKRLTASARAAIYKLHFLYYVEKLTITYKFSTLEQPHHLQPLQPTLGSFDSLQVARY